MLTSKKLTLKPLLESAEGLHLTAYLVKGDGAKDLKKQLRDTINEAYEWLNPVMSSDERNRFLEPLDALLLDTRIFQQMKGNIGIFRNWESFRVLNVPVEVEQTCQVATSFHVKPLLRWLQHDQEFLLLGLDKDSAHLYLGSQDSLKLVDTILFPEFFKKTNFLDGYIPLKELSKRQAEEEATFDLLNEWITEMTRVAKPKLFVAGEKRLSESMNLSLTYKNAIKSPIAYFFSKEKALDLAQAIRKILKEDSKKLIEKTLQEFRLAEEGSRVRKNIFQISKAVVRGKVRKLVVTDELNIFGKIDKKSGGLAIHPFDLDHEDDDILDDLAQMVLSQGGEVIVATRDEIPKGRAILAILEDELENLEKKGDLRPYDETEGSLG